MSEENGSTALVSIQIQEAVAKALDDVQQFIDSDDTKEKMQYVLVRQVVNNTDLQRCTPESFAVAVYEMFKLGLDPRGQNEAWLIPYSGKAALQVGYAGKRKLALNDPRVEDVYAKPVYANDTYVLDPHTGQPLHTYAPFGPRGQIVGYYGAVRYVGGAWHTEEMDVPAMRLWRNTFSKAAQKTVWKESRGQDGLSWCSFDGMAVKTMLSRICHTKHMTLSPEAQSALSVDDRLYGRERDVTPHDTGYTPTTEEATQHIADMTGGSDAQDAYTRAVHPDGVATGEEREAPPPNPPRKDWPGSPQAEKTPAIPAINVLTALEAEEPPVPSSAEILQDLGDTIQAEAEAQGFTKLAVWQAMGPLLPNGLDFTKLTAQTAQTAHAVSRQAIRGLVKEREAAETPTEEDQSVPPFFYPAVLKAIIDAKDALEAEDAPPIAAEFFDDITGNPDVDTYLRETAQLLQIPVDEVVGSIEHDTLGLLDKAKTLGEGEFESYKKALKRIIDKEGLAP